MEAHGDGVVARLLDRLGEVHAAAVNLVALLLERVGDVHRRDGAVEQAVLADLALEAEAQVFHLRRLRLGARALARLALEQGRALGLDLLDVARRRLDGEPARQEVVARETGLDLHDLAARAEVIHVLA